MQAQVLAHTQTVTKGLLFTMADKVISTDEVVRVWSLSRVLQVAGRAPAIAHNKRKPRTFQRSQTQDSHRADRYIRGLCLNRTGAWVESAGDESLAI